MISKIQRLKRKAKLKIYKNISNYYNEMKKKFQVQEDPFSKSAQGISKYYHEVLPLTKLLQTKHSVNNMNFNYYDLFYTVTKNTDIIYDKNEDDYFKFNDFVTPNHYIGIKPRETIIL